MIENPTIGSLCTGSGALDMAAVSVTGGKVTWVSENDKIVSRLLTHHYPNIPNIGDLTTATPDPVDIITAGFPCQPVSAIGQRKGMADDRWLWPHIMRIADTMPRRPALMLENVPGLLTINNGTAWAGILSDLDRRGYSVAFRVFAATDVGACHRRNRVFILAEHPDNLISINQENISLPPPIKPPHIPTPIAQTSDPSPQQLENIFNNHYPSQYNYRNKEAGPLIVSLFHSDARSPNDWGKYAPAIQRHTEVLDREPPAPTINDRLNPAFIEWMMMLPEGHVTSPEFGLSKSKQLHALGNGVVPIQAATAFKLIATNK